VLDFNGNRGAVVEPGDGHPAYFLPPHEDPISMTAVFRWDSSPGSYWGSILSCGSNYSVFPGAHLVVFSGGEPAIRYQNHRNSYVQLYGTPLVSGRWYAITGTKRRGSAFTPALFDLYVDGVSDNQTYQDVSHGLYDDDAVQRWCLGTDRSAVNEVDGRLAFAAVHDRALSHAEVTELHADPLILLRRRTKRHFVVPDVTAIFVPRPLFSGSAA
jgi:hypothetical protein